MTSPNIEVIKYLVKRGARVNIQDEQGNTLLHYAADPANGCSAEIGRFLLQKGLKIDARNDQGETALMRAAVGDIGEGKPTSDSSLEFVKVLVRGGAHLNFRDQRGQTALDVATGSETIRFLKKAGAKH